VSINYVDRSQRANHNTTPPPTMVYVVDVNYSIIRLSSY